MCKDSNEKAAAISTLKDEASIIEKLVTSEDPYHVHKTLGIAVLVSFLVRACNYGESDCLFATYPNLTLPTVVLHLLLNASSFQFHIPSRRIATGYRIWPEYRLHALCFLSYTLLIILTMWVEEAYNLPRLHWANYLITMTIMLAADRASASAGKYQSNSIRDLEVPAWVKFYFSYAQFTGKSACLYFPARRYTFFYFAAFGLQLNPFLMTLRRKNVASHNLLVAIYGFALLFVTFIAATEVFQHGGGWMTVHYLHSISCLAFMMRIGPRFPRAVQFLHNKYVIWTIMSGILHFWFLPRLQDGGESNHDFYSLVKHMSIASGVVVHSYGWYKRNIMVTVGGKTTKAKKEA
jgi:hypothetical protein